MGKKLKEKKVRNGKEKKNMERGRIEQPSRIDLAQESNALPVISNHVYVQCKI